MEDNFAFILKDFSSSELKKKLKNKKMKFCFYFSLSFLSLNKQL
jgi:hypothetical protein